MRRVKFALSKFLKPRFVAKFHHGQGTVKSLSSSSKRKYFGILSALFVASLLLEPFNNMGPLPYVSPLTPEIEALIESENYPLYDQKLVRDHESKSFEFNEGYQSNVSQLGFNSGPKFSGSFPVDANEGFTVTDPFTQTSIEIIPEFKLGNGQKDGSRIVYPLSDYNGIKVVTLTAAGYKEDLVLYSFEKNNIDFKYRLELPSGLEARLEADGSVGVYGVDQVLLGTVATGSEEDEKLLEAARQNQPKSSLIFSIPAPFIQEKGTRDTAVGVYYSLEDNVLTTHVEGLVNAQSWPLTIDPSVYVDTAIKLSRGNNETNIDFDVSNELIQKGATTGGRFQDWANTMALDNNHWDAGTAVANGYVYSIGGALADDSMYMTPGESEFVVPTGVTSISVKSWGAGGGGGGASEDGNGGDGGGGGYAAATLSVTAGEVLTVRVGEGGDAGRYTAPDDVIVGDGGGGGGYSGIFRTSTALLVAAGGGGGGGDNGAGTGSDGGAGGAGGGATGVAGTDDGTTTGGGGGTASSGGAAGTNSTSGGTAGSSLQGGTGASERNAFSGTSLNGGGAGGKGSTSTVTAERDPGGGGGGGGYYGGGGGGRANADAEGGAGGGGGSSYVTGTSTSNTAGSGTTPGNSGDADRNGAGDGGAGGVETGGAPGDASEGDDGLVVITVSGNQVDATNDVWWAEIDSSNQLISSPNPGAGACTQWCSDTAYDLPEARKGASVVAYNGFIYVVGGENASGTRQTTVYIGKLGANGEPSLWHPTDTNKDNWVYWYSDTALATERSYGSLVAYNNRLYYLGGQTNAATGGVTTVEYSNIEPTGTLESWTSTGMTALPSARHNHAVLMYNNHMYLIGGNSSGTIQSAVHYVNIKADGTMDGSWEATTSLDTARMAWGGKFAAIFGGFIYIAGGCSAVNGSGYCTTVQDDVRLNSMNTNGSLTKWTTILDVTNERIGHGLEAWGGALYTIGGCRLQNATTGDCDWGVTQNVYGNINSDGDASTVRNSVLSGTAPCSGGSPTDCSLPPEGDNNGKGGNMSGGAIINNGIIYYFGGCIDVGNGSVCYTGASGKATDNVYYAAIGDDGQLGQVSSCTGSGLQFYGSWCVDNSAAGKMPDQRAGMGITLFDNTVYIIGGTTGTEFSADLMHMTLNADGSLGTWSTQTFSDLDLGTERGYMYAFTRANPASAGTYPGNLYVIGGCAPSPVTTDGLDCSDTQFTEVYKCNITTTGALETADANDCTTTGQLQIDSEPGTGGNQGLGVMAGTVYANFIYLIGGQSPNEDERGTVMYAKIDDSNNIVAASGSIWQTSGNEIDPVRRRGSAFGYNGYLYALAGYNSGETLNDLLYAKIDVSDGSIGAFTESDVTVLPRWDLQAIVSNGFVFALGGCNTGVPPQDCQTMQRTVQTFQLYNNYSGSPAGYTVGANLFTTDRIGASAAVLDGYIYIAGGCTSATDCTTATDNVQYATISGSGDIGTWSNTTDATLPAVRAWGQLEVAGGTLYYIGGQSSTATDERSEVYYGTPSSGDVSAWSTATNGLPAARTQHSAAVWNDRIYVLGGLDSTASETNTVYYSMDLSSGGDITSAWSTDTDTFDVTRSGHTTIAYANNLYVFGGYDGSNYLNDAQFTQINSDGSVDAWTFTTSLPEGIRQADGFASNGYLYLIGGRTDDTTCASNTWVTPISANTTIASGNNPTGVGAWYETIESYNGDRYGAAVVVNDGVAYALGGGCGATLTYTGANRIVESVMQAQPQVARYSYFIDADSDIFPTKWLANGLDNDIGARWNMNYRSSTDANNEWGQNTDFGAITLGSVETYTPLDDLGVDTDFARYFYLQLDIDSSQAYGYPDDVTRGPTIDDLTLFFTADPAKSLRHGKTFIQGLQQPLNTPPP